MGSARGLGIPGPPVGDGLGDPQSTLVSGALRRSKQAVGSGRSLSNTSSVTSRSQARSLSSRISRRSAFGAHPSSLMSLLLSQQAHAYAERAQASSASIESNA